MAKSTEDVYLDYLNKELNSVEKTLGLSSNSLSEKGRLSSGVLVYDLILGGGIVPGFYVNSAFEQAGKSTLNMEMLRAALKQGVALKAIHDAETTITRDTNYALNILHAQKWEDVFGKEGKKGWEILPKIRYYNDQILEKIFKGTIKALKALPDKTYLREKQQWYFVFDRTKDEMAMMKALQLTPDKSLFTRYGKYYCPTDRQGVEAFILWDSIPSFIPANIEDDSDEGNALGILARELGKPKHLPKVKGLLQRKACALVAVNQLRERPMAKGDPVYEPCGHALENISDVRNRLFVRAVPEGWERGKDDDGNPSSKYSVERSVTAHRTKDSYVFRKIDNTKNKTGTPYRKGWIRIWIQDHNGKGQGVDPVYDTYQYLNMTGQFVGSRNDGKVKKVSKLEDNFKVRGKGFRIDMPEFKGLQFNWMLFKRMILAEDSGNKQEMAKVAKLLGKKKLPRLRKICFEQVKSGKAGTMYEARKVSREKGDD